MTSRLTIDIGAQEQLRLWHQKLAGYYRYDTKFSPKPGTSIKPHIELGKLYFMGTAGDIRYGTAIEHIKKALTAELSPHCLVEGYTFIDKTDEEFAKPAMYNTEEELQTALKDWNGETINRIEILKNAGFDGLLNLLRAEVLQSIDPESEVLTELFENLWQASYEFATKKNPDLSVAKKEFRTTTIKAIGNIPKTLIKDDLATLITKILGAIASICSLGIANYVTGRSMVGLFSSRIDTAVKLSDLLTELEHPKDNTGKGSQSLPASSL